MNSRDLMNELRRRYGEPNNRLLADHLGVSYETIKKWHSSNVALTVKQVWNLIDKAKKADMREAYSSSIRPIVEYYGIEASESKQGVVWELFDSAVSGNKRQEKIKGNSENHQWRLRFYDSRGAPYALGRRKTRVSGTK